MCNCACSKHLLGLLRRHAGLLEFLHTNNQPHTSDMSGVDGGELVVSINHAQV